MSTPTEPLTDTLVERVDELLETGKPPRVWGSPHLSSTRTSIAVYEFAKRTEVLEAALRILALEVQKLSEH